MYYYEDEIFSFWPEEDSGVREKNVRRCGERINARERGGEGTSNSGSTGKGFCI